MPNAPLPGKRMALALLILFGCGLMFFVERNDIFAFTSVAMLAALFITVSYLYISFLTNRKFILTSFYQIYFMMGLLASAASISTGAQMVEVGAHGTANGSFWLVLAFFVVGMEATCFGFQSNLASTIGPKLPEESWDLSRLIMVSALSAAVIMSLYIFMTVGSPTTLGIDRVTFWRYFAPSYLSLLPSFVLQTYFLLCFYLLISKKKQDNTLIPYLFFFVYILITAVVLGEKFSAFIILLNALLTVVAGTHSDFRIRPSFIILGILCAILLLLLIAFSYIAEGRDPSFILSRIALQAQLIWSVLSDPYGFRLLPSSDWPCFFGCGWFEDGRDYMAYKYLPYGLYNFYYDNGTDLSGFMPALPLLTFGVALAFGIHIGICFLVGILQREVCHAIRRENLIAAFLLYKILLGVLLSWFTATLSPLMGTFAAAGLFILYFALFARKSRSVSFAVAKEV